MSVKIGSRTLQFSDFDSHWYKKWSIPLKQYGKHIQNYKLRSNKFWQNAIIAQILYDNDMLKTSKKGIGFGVGQERLPAFFASKEVVVTATDQKPTTRAKLWQENELAKSLDSLNNLGICNQRDFLKNVSFRHVDMRKIPQIFYNKYDFVWSNCALGHLGSIDEGLRFILESARCLKPSGVAVHTTEINVTEDDITADQGSTVVFRPKDLIKLAAGLRRAGFSLEIPRLSFGKSSDDERVSFSPEFGNDYSKILISGHIATQIVLIVKRKKPGLLYNQRHLINYRSNLREQKRFRSSHPIFKKIYPGDNHRRLYIKPLKTKRTMNIKNVEKSIYLEYVNYSSTPIFSAHTRPYFVNPITLGTARPRDRVSIFKGSDWLGNQPNRAAPEFYKRKGNSWEKIDVVLPNEKFAFRVALNPAFAAPNRTYSEWFNLVDEGAQHLDGCDVQVIVKT